MQMSAQAEQAKLQRTMAEQMMKSGMPFGFGGFAQQMPVGCPSGYAYAPAPVQVVKH
jgi:hypothetical protein